MAKDKGYHAAHTNKNQGQKTHGKFKNDGQKKGHSGPIKTKPAKEKDSGVNADTHQYMNKVVADLRKQGKRRINMLPGSGAFA
jgi:hypothetical protein